MNNGTVLIPPPHPVQKWKILSVREGKTVPNPKADGSLTRYYVDFEGMEDGWCNADGAFWQRKQGNSPNKDEEVYGEITVGEYGYKFQLRKPDDDPATTERASTDTFEHHPEASPAMKQAAGQPQGGEGPDARQRSIVRQHSQQVVCEFLALCDIKAEPTPEWLEMNFAPLVDWVVADASGNAFYQSDVPF